MKRTMKSVAMFCAAMSVCFGTMAADTPAVTENESATAEMNANARPPLTVAVLPFGERGDGVTDQGDATAQLLFAGLAENPNIWLVERDKIDQILKEAELNISGVVDPAAANKIGRLIGAKVLITGSVFKIKGKTYVVAKVIGAETSRVFGKSASGVGGVDQLAGPLSADVSKILEKNARELVAGEITRENVIAALKQAIGDAAPAPVVYVYVNERHVGEAIANDPAVTTELQRILKALNFKVTEDRSAADRLLTGEAFSEFAGRRGNLISVKGRVELKITDKKDNVLAADHQATVEIGLAESVAGKEALQKAADQLAERVIPKLIAK